VETSSDYKDNRDQLLMTNGKIKFDMSLAGDRAEAAIFAGQI
jgi:hypothetical protein